MNRWIASSIAGLGLLFALSAGAADGHVFTFRIPGEPETLDWNKAHTPIETYLLMNLMEGLIGVDADLKITPALAKSWKLSPDGKTYTFNLRNDVKWSDGVPLKAADFLYSWKRLLSPMTAASYAYFLFDIEGAEGFYKGTVKDFSGVGVKALDDYTIQVKLVQPVAHWIYIPSFWVTFPMRQDVVEKGGSGWATPGRMVSVGPFQLESHDLDSRIVLKANPNYYGVRGNLEKAVALIIRDDATALSLYESGKLDFLTDIATLDLKRLAGRPDLKSYPYLKTGYLGFVVDKFPLSNVHFRRALAMSIDRTKMGMILHGGQQPANSFIPPRMLGHSPRMGLPFDPVKAKNELRASGVDMAKPPLVEFVIANWDKSMVVAQFIQGEVKRNLGVDLSIQPFDNKTFRAQLDLHSYPLYLSSWSADYPDPDNFMSVFLSSSGNNRLGWKNEAYDRLVMSARRMQDLRGREKAYGDAQKILLEEDAVLAPLYYEPNMALVRPRVQGLELNPLNYLYLKKVNCGG